VFQFSLSPFSLAALDLVEWIFTRFGKFPTISHTQTLNPCPPPTHAAPAYRGMNSHAFLKKCEVGDNFKRRDGWMVGWLDGF